MVFLTAARLAWISGKLPPSGYPGQVGVFAFHDVISGRLSYRPAVPGYRYGSIDMDERTG